MYKGRLRSLVDNDYLHDLFSDGYSDSYISQNLSEQLGVVSISRQNVQYWRKQWEARSPNAKVNMFNKSAANRQIKKDVSVRTPSESDWQAVGATHVDKVHDYIVVIPDLHIPMVLDINGRWVGMS